MLLAGLLFSTTVFAQTTFQRVEGQTSSQELREIIKTHRGPAGNGPYAVINKHWKPNTQLVRDTNEIDPFLQSTFGTLAGVTEIADFDGVSDDDNSALLGFAVVPPDTQGDVGPNHYVQHVNLSAEIFDKNGVSLTGPFAGNAFWAGLGGSCENDNSGDPITLYDHINDRWIINQFEASSPFGMCIAVSATSDPLGAYHQYRFDYGIAFPDYEKLGLWATDDGTEVLMMTDRQFDNLAIFRGLNVSAFEYEEMLNGNPAGHLVTDIPGGTAIDGYLPADLDGPPAPAGTLPLVFGHESNQVKLFTADPNFGAGTMPVVQIGTFASTFDEGLGNVVPPAPGESLATLTFAAMHRLQYRNFGTHETLVVSATVDAGSDLAGMKWWELRDSGGGWGIHQEGTYAPDTQERWMGSIAMNGNGDIALGFSITSPSRFPSIAVTGQTSDMSGTGIMNIAETELHAGAGVQTGSANRWGDYSMMAVDPSDDTSFWYTQEYYGNTGSFDFKTRITHFSLEEAVGDTPVVRITSPLDGDMYATGALVSFAGSATDTEDGDLSAILDWNSSIDGAIGTGAAFDLVLSDGTHVITASATDSDGNTGSGAVTIMVGDEPPPPGDCSSFTEVTMDDGFAFHWCWDGTKIDGAVGPGGSDGVTQPPLVCATDGLLDAELVGTLEGAYASASSSGAVCRSTGGGGLATQVEAVNEAGDGCTSFSDSFTYDGTPTGSLGYAGTWWSYCDGLGAIATGSWSGTFDPSGLVVPTFEGAVKPWMGGAAIAAAKAPAANALAAKALEGVNALDVPTEFGLDQNYPNPFNPSTMIRFAMPQASQVTLRVYNLLGQQVAELVNGRMDVGRHQVAFDASGLSAGVYLYVLEAGDFTATKRLTLLK
jgi:hypothetical protein